MSTRYDELSKEDKAIIARAERSAKIVNGKPVFNRSFFDRAACIGEPIDTFFPKTRAKGNRAKAICAACPVQMDCLMDGLTNRYSLKAGFSGGMGPKGRQELAARLEVEVDDYDPMEKYLGGKYWGINWTREQEKREGEAA